MLKIYLCTNDKPDVPQCKSAVYQIIKLRGRKNKKYG